jgi:predicted Zn finger-like uncharacterized protein
MKRIIFYHSIFIILFILSLIFVETSLAKSNDTDLFTEFIVIISYFFGFILIITIIVGAIGLLFEGSKKAVIKISESVKDKKQKAKCPHCQTLYFITENQIGKETICGNCHNKFTIKEYIVLKTVN